jgi:hypothetical protein
MPRHSTTPLSKAMGRGTQVDPLLPGAAAGMALPVQQRAVQCRIAQGGLQAAAPLVVEGFEQLVGGGEQVLLFETKQLLAAFADKQEAIVTRLVTSQMKQHAGQVGGEGIETRLALVEHFQCSAVVAPVTGFAHLAVDGRQQVIQAVDVDHVAHAHGHCRANARPTSRSRQHDDRQIGSGFVY